MTNAFKCKSCDKVDGERFEGLHGFVFTTMQFGDPSEGLCLNCWTKTHYRREDDIHLKNDQRHKKKKDVTISSNHAAAGRSEFNKSLQQKICICGCGSAVEGNAKKQFASGACRVRYHRQQKAAQS